MGQATNTALFIWTPMKEIYPQRNVLGTIGFRLSTAPSMWRRQIKVSSRASTFKMAVRGSQVIKLNLNCANKEPNYRGGPHMRSLISIDFPAPEMEPESVHVVSAVSVPQLHCGDCNVAPPRQHSPIRRYSALLRYSVVCFNSITQCN